jgi:hypothetical protein
MKKEVILSLISIVLFLIVLPMFLAQDISFCVNAEVSDISPSSIKIGEEFTIGIHIENCGYLLPDNVFFEITGLPEHISVKEPLVTLIPKIQYSNSERFLVYHMKVDDEAQSGTYVIKTKLSYSRGTVEVIEDDEISINIIGDEAKLSIASIKTDPVLPYEGQTVELTLRIENFGEGTANAVKVYAEHPFRGIKESFIGTLDSDEDGPAVFTFIPKKSGDFEIPVNISYKDDFGDDEVQTKINLTILKKEINWIAIIVSIILISLAVWGIIYFSKLKKTKNKIIHELLQGTSFDSKDLNEDIKKHIKKSQEEKKKSDRKEEKRLLKKRKK